MDVVRMQVRACTRRAKNMAPQKRFQEKRACRPRGFSEFGLTLHAGGFSLAASYFCRKLHALSLLPC